MNWKALLVAVILLDFLALTGLALWESGYVGLFQYQLATWAGMQVLADLVIACALIALWMYRDARQRGVNPWPYLLLTMAAGSIGPLAYLLRRQWGREPTPLAAGV